MRKARPPYVYREQTSYQSDAEYTYALCKRIREHADPHDIELLRGWVSLFDKKTPFLFEAEIILEIYS